MALRQRKSPRSGSSRVGNFESLEQQEAMALNANNDSAAALAEENALLKKELQEMRALLEQYENSSGAAPQSQRMNRDLCLDQIALPSLSIWRNSTSSSEAELASALDTNSEGLHHRHGARDMLISNSENSGTRRRLSPIKAKQSDEMQDCNHNDIEASPMPCYAEHQPLVDSPDRSTTTTSTPKIQATQSWEDNTAIISFGRMILDRSGWLVGLLILQSLSSFIIQRNEVLLQKHLVIVRFLTMLVGAGGNAGNQASVRVIRGLAVGTIKINKSVKALLLNECAVGLSLSFILGIAGCLRAAVFMTPVLETVAITASLFCIVMLSVLLGAILPLGMKVVGIDPAHSSTTIQVLMDILGVLITVSVSGLVLDSGLTTWLGLPPNFFDPAAMAEKL